MASKRQLKKDINYLTFDLLAECFTYQFFHKDLKSEVVDDIASGILDNRNDLVARINHIDGKEDTKLVKAHFRKIREDFAKSVEMLDKLAKQ
jgi:hypothetical protein